MENNELKEMLALLKDTDISELQIEKDGTKIKIRRQMVFSPVEVQPRAHTVIESSKEPEEEVQRLITATSPIVGTFYRAASPEAAHFVEAGMRVKKGQVLCIIEAMKLMNEIESEFDGVIVRALVENGHPVEYGEPLFLIDPA